MFNFEKCFQIVIWGILLQNLKKSGWTVRLKSKGQINKKINVLLLNLGNTFFLLMIFWQNLNYLPFKILLKNQTSISTWYFQKSLFPVHHFESLGRSTPWWSHGNSRCLHYILPQLCKVISVFWQSCILWLLV